jgi:hypothetical protein
MNRMQKLNNKIILAMADNELRQAQLTLMWSWIK